MPFIKEIVIWYIELISAGASDCDKIRLKDGVTIEEVIMEGAEKIARKAGELWEESSGFLKFLAGISAEVKKFDDATGFEIRSIITPPLDVDGDTAKGDKTGFVVIRENRVFSERTYCLYSVLEKRELHGYIGIYKEGHIQTLRELKPVKDFSKGKTMFYDWLRALVKASCEK
jgi:hypothetical protein